MTVKATSILTKGRVGRGAYDPRATNPKISVAFTPDEMKLIRAEAIDRNISFASRVRELVALGRQSAKKAAE